MFHVEAETAPFPRLSRPLNVTVVGGLGLTDGIAVWLDEGRLDFIVRERLEISRNQLVRVDLAGLGEQADLNVRLVRVLRGSETPYRKGWFHSGTWEPLDDRNRIMVENFLERSEVGSRSVGLSQTSILRSETLATLASGSAPTSTRSVPPRTPHPGDSIWGPGPSVASESGGRARVRRSLRRARDRMAGEPTEGRTAAVVRERGREPSGAGHIEDRRAPQPAVQPGARRSAAQGERRGISPTDIVRPVLSTVGGTSLMATFAFAGPLGRCLRLGDNKFRLVLERVGGLTPLQPLQLVLQLPDGSFVQARARVLTLGPDRVLIEAVDVEAMTVAVLRSAVGAIRPAGD